MSENHTRGPWEWNGRAPVIFGPDHQCICMNHPDQPDKAVKARWFNGNAALIAAAPELLDALHGLIQSMEAPDALNDYCLKVARRAIAKARRQS